MAEGLLLIVSAPSGCGKGTILNEVFKRGNFYYSVSATTRKPREGEVDGVNYHFLERNAFEDMIASDKVIEYTEFCGNYYGTLREPVYENLHTGRDVILEIEVNGAAQVKKKCPEAVSVFILPPAIETLRERLTGRGTESAEVIEKRVAEARGEIEKAYGYDYVIVNDDLDTAVAELLEIISAEKKSAARSVKLIDSILGK